MSNPVVEKHSSAVKPIEFSDAAKAHVQRYLEKNPKAKGLRLSVKKTGCSGLSYVVDFVEQASADDMAFPLVEACPLFVDKSSYPFLQGMLVDYVKEGFNARFVFQNPNQTGSCGCGESFTVS